MNAIVAVLEREVEAQQRVGAEFTDGSATRYALRAMHNQLIDAWRRRRRDEKLPSDLIAPSAPLDDPQNEDSAARLVVSALLDELVPNDRALLEAYFTSHDEYYAEAQRQGLTATSARSRIYSLLTRLRRDGWRLR